MLSLDFYDTLVTRLVATPQDIFVLVGEKIGIADFKPRRVAAERQAVAARNGVPTLEQIYSYLDLTDDIKAAACAEELRLETLLLSAIAENAALTRLGDYILVSDMYLPNSVYLSVLDRLHIARPEALYLSWQLGVSKSAGEMWPVIRSHHPSISSHVGDNSHSDVAQPQRAGLAARHYRSGGFNAAETRLASAGFDASLIAAVSRATRLELTTANLSAVEAAVIDTFASIFAPVFFAFCEWLVEQSAARGSQKIFFLARDGQICWKIFRAMGESRALQMPASYIYASRQALYLPGFVDVAGSQTWILDNTPMLCLSDIAHRTEIDPGVFAAAAARFMSVGVDDNLSPEQRQILPRILQEPEVRDAIAASSARVFEAANSYYRAQGLCDYDTVSVVDVGWNGRMQKSLRSLIEKSGSSQPQRIEGFYLCLSRRVNPAAQDRLSGFLAEPNPDGSYIFYDHYRDVIEASMSADHGSTLRFSVTGTSVQPILGPLWQSNMLHRVQLQHKVVTTFCEKLLHLERTIGRRVICPIEQIKSNYRQMLVDPTVTQATAFLDFDFPNGQEDRNVMSIVRKISVFQIFGDKSSIGCWREGTLRASGLNMRLETMLRLLEKVLRKLEAILRIVGYRRS